MQAKGQRCFAFAHASLGYSDGIVQRDFSWEVSRGEGWIISGANGAGKTTLVRTLLGLLPLQGGHLHFFDERGDYCSRPSMGYLPQINRIDKAFPITAGEVVRSGLVGEGLSSRQETERVAYLIDAIGLESYRDEPIGRLSGGELQRVLLARALAAEASVLVLDEPDSFLDPSGRSRLGELIHTLTPSSCTIVMISHQSEQDAGGWIQPCSPGHERCSRVWKRLEMGHRHLSDPSKG